MPRLTEEKAERNLRLALLAIVVLTVPCTVAAFLCMDGISPLHKLWVGIGGANLLVWTSVFLAALCNWSAQAVRSLRVSAARMARNADRRRAADEAGDAGLALEA
jgi:hypothetical protein